MTSALLPPNLVFRAYTQTGTPAPLAGGLLYFYQAGTSTPQAAYSDATATIPLSNPITLDANGQASFWLKSGLSYKLNLTDSVGAQQSGWPQDGIVADPTATILASLAASTGATLLSDVTPWTGSVARSQHLKNSDVKSVKDWGAKGDGATDDTAAIQAALNYSSTYNVGIYFPAGVYLISNTLTYGTGTTIIGESWASTIIRMSTLPTGGKPTFVGSTSYTPTLAYFPILWNNTGIQWFRIHNIQLDGNNLNVYGLRLQENFYGDIEDVYITNCNQYAYINVRGQSVKHKHLVLYHNQGGMLTLDNTAMNFDACGFEQTGGFYCIEMRAPTSTKCGTSFRDCWFEDGTTSYQVGYGASFTGSTATNVLTLGSTATGTFALGQTLVGSGIPGGTIIQSLATGTLGVSGSTYNLSTTPGTVSSEAMTTTQAGSAVLALSGRNMTVENGFFNMTGPTLALRTIGVADGRTFDGISNANVQGVVNGKFNLNCVSTGLGVTFSVDTGFSSVDGFYQNTQVTDNAGGAGFTGNITTGTSVLNVTSMTTGILAVGQTLNGAGISSGIIITGLGTGTGGVGNYNLSGVVGASFTASTATNVLTLTSNATGNFQLGQQLTGAGITAGTVIQTLASGTLGQNGSTYTLSTTPGTLSSESMTSAAASESMTTTAPSGAGGNTFNLNPAFALPFPHLTGRFQVRQGPLGSALPLSLSAYVFDADWNYGTPIIRLLGNNNNSIDLNSGVLRYKANTGIQLSPGQNGGASSGDITCTQNNGAFYPPMLTTTQKTGLTTVGAGAIVYDTTLSKLQVYSGGSWVNLI